MKEKYIYPNFPVALVVDDLDVLFEEGITEVLLFFVGGK